MQTVTLIDVGVGNLHSVQKALETCGARVVRTRSPEEVLHARRVILPGVGAFASFMQELHAAFLDQALQEAVQSGALLLGICLGMQVMFEMSEEQGEHKGLGWLPGRVQRFPHLPGLLVPHTGWNQALLLRSSPLFAHLSKEEYFYFNHSYYCPAEGKATLAWSEHGVTFAAAVEWENLRGVQFHPEKSQAAGLRLLRNFLELP
uniref:Imidazole glycerol phosphate synthase subunit HisH n=1 Tax=uncultured Chloroflexota bacterium TaxID=166587 RepID=H5SBG4_9CHLR|nr:imidazole glycerol phosphate synthase, glutamine amidotransferase subunit HisH [uncultured Chloroflexota bacterium]